MHDSGQTSVTGWIEQLKQGSDKAAHDLWQRYFEQVVAVARQRLGSGPRRTADEEDVAVSVFDSLYRGAAEGRFDRLTDRQDLWMLLLAITRQKAVDEIRRRTRKKRGGGEVRGESVFVSAGETEGGVGLEQFCKEAPNAELLISAQEECDRLLSLLRDDKLRIIALLRLEGFSNEEIAEQSGVSTRTIERKLQLIRDTWEAETVQ